MKKFASLVAASFVAIATLASCGDNGNSTPTYEVRMLKKIESVGGNSTGSLTFVYDDLLRVKTASLKINDQSATMNFAYQANSITVTVGSGSEAATVVHTLDDGGYVVHNTDNSYDNPVDFDFDYTDGQLSKITYTQNPELTYTVAWQNGNMTKKSFGSTVETWSYGSNENKLNINILDLLGVYALPGDIPSYFYSKGLFTKNLPTSWNYSSASYQQGYSFAYTLDSEGYPTKVVSTPDEVTEDDPISTYTVTYY